MIKIYVHANDGHPQLLLQDEFHEQRTELTAYGVTPNDWDSELLFGGYVRVEEWEESAGKFETAVVRVSESFNPPALKAAMIKEARNVMGDNVSARHPVVVDQDGFKTWPVIISRDPGSCVKLRKTDGKLTIDGVSIPFASPAHALSLGWSLIAAARYVMDQHSSTSEGISE